MLSGGLARAARLAAPPLRPVHTSTVACKVSSGKYKVTPRRNRPLTYEQANTPHVLFVRKGFNSINTSNLLDGVRPSETAVEDLLIRRFMVGTWHNQLLSEVIIKRQLNMIRVAAIVTRSLLPRQIYFLIGYTEELLTHWLQCPVKLELQTTADRKDVVFKHI